MKIVGIEWDSGNWPKCGKHGVSSEYAEIRVRDPNPYEIRFRTATQTSSGRYVFVVYTYRTYGNDTYIRPVSARHMHQKEIENYERR